ncbi:MAG: hypothetical protein NC320_13335 [Clostridium sp.]|nr:hypothetical protein [Clostridium sp.]
MGFFLAIAGAIAAGALIAYAVAFTAKWFKEKVQKMFNKRKNAKKVAAVKLEKMVEECPNEISLDNLLDDGYTHVMASVDYNGKIDDVEIIKDTCGGDYEVDEMLGDEEMIVVTR